MLALHSWLRFNQWQPRWSPSPTRIIPEHRGRISPEHFWVGFSKKKQKCQANEGMRKRERDEREDKGWQMTCSSVEYSQIKKYRSVVYSNKFNEHSLICFKKTNRSEFSQTLELIRTQDALQISVGISCITVLCHSLLHCFVLLHILCYIFKQSQFLHTCFGIFISFS